MEKTNVMRILDKLKVQYTPYCYVESGAISAVDLADALGLPHERVFKTLVTVGKSGEHHIYMIPSAEELDLKKAAEAVGEKSVSMIKSKDLLGTTGYIHGGCSPIGMKKTFGTVVHKSSENYEKIVFSAGKIGYQVEMSLESLGRAVRFTTADVIVDRT